MRLLKWIADSWCEIAHPAPRLPFRGYRECPLCLRRKRVQWEDTDGHQVTTRADTIPSTESHTREAFRQCYQKGFPQSTRSLEGGSKQTAELGQVRK